MDWLEVVGGGWWVDWLEVVGGLVGGGGWIEDT